MTPQELKTSLLTLAMKGRLLSDSEWDDSFYVPLWKVTAWDKHFKNVDKSKQKKVISYKYVLANEFARLERPSGDVFLLSTGNYCGYTTSEIGGELVSAGEVVTMPWGGGPTIKYFKGKFITSDNRIATSLDTDILDNKYLYYFMLSQVNYLDSIYRGTSLRHPEMALVLEMKIPLPSIEEQKRIVARIEELLPLIERYEEAWNKLESFNKKFPLDMEKSLLYYASKGKLLNQDSAEGTGKELLDNIIELRNKELPSKKQIVLKIDDDESPFDIPLSWTWCKISDIAEVKGGKRIPAGRKLTNENTGHIYIRVSDMKNNSVNMSNLMYVPNDIYPSISRYIINKEDVYITVAGTIGAVGCIPDELDGANLTENADRLVFNNINKKWLTYCLSSDVVQQQIRDATTKVGQPKLAILRIENIRIPLPPLEEQKRIVAKLEELLPLCRKLVK